MKVVLAQLSSSPGDPSANGARVVEVLDRYPDAEIAVFPELFLSGYSDAIVPEVAEQCAAELESVASAAAKAHTAVVVGLPILEEGKRRNAVACIDETGDVVATYAKLALFQTEERNFSSGAHLVVVRLAGVKVAPLICFDIEFPELSRAVARAGAELLVVVAANMDPYYRDHELFSRVRALENRLPLVYVNQVGSAELTSFVGGSRAVTDDGSVLLELSCETEADGVAELSVGSHIDPRVDYLRQLVPVPPVAYAAGNSDCDETFISSNKRRIAKDG
jgi:predicted amidohydrolase